jgi:hypothetical protein
MQEAQHILIHHFENFGHPFLDDEGDRMLGFYYQFIDKNNIPISNMIGPYSIGDEAEKAALKAMREGDF